MEPTGSSSEALEFLREIFDKSGMLPRSSNVTIRFKLRSFISKTICAIAFMASLAHLVMDLSIDSLNAAILLSGMASILIQHFHMHFNKDYTKLINLADSLCRTFVVDDKQIECLRANDIKSIKKAKLMLFFFALYTPENMIAVIFEYILFGRLKLPFQMWTPFPQYWIISSIYQSIIAGIPIICYITYINNLSILISLASCLIRILNDLIKNRPIKLSKEYDSKCYQLHVSILKFVRLTNETFGGIVTAQLFFSSIPCCLTGYELIKASATMDWKILVNLIVFIMSLAVPFIHCFSGQLLSLEGENLHFASYESRWYETDSDCRKGLIILMTQTTQPILINYRGIVKFDMERFVTVVQAAYTYITVLNFLDNNGII